MRTECSEFCNRLQELVSMPDEDFWMDSDTADSDPFFVSSWKMGGTNKVTALLSASGKTQEMVWRAMRNRKAMGF